MTAKSIKPTVHSEERFLNDQAQLVRAGAYELLATLLAREPSAEVLTTLASIEAVDTADGPVAMGWELLRQASVKAKAESVGDEYGTLFIGLGRGEVVPFGSWYLTGFLMEKPLSVLRGDLLALGIERQAGVVESEDHIASLCDAMALIIRHGHEISFPRQKRFFEDHLAPWAGQFFADLQSARSADFYRSVGFFGQSFIEFEQQLFLMQS